MSSKSREEYLRDVPGFINLILLLMDSGLILQDAFFRAAEGHGDMEESSAFYMEIRGICSQSQKTGNNVIMLFHRFSLNSGVKELMRVSGIMEEHLGKGIDLRGKLAEECEWLWQEKKRLTMENIRLRESKMTFPLALLLISLLLVSVGPAFLQIQG